MKRAVQMRTYVEYANQFIATNQRTGRVVAHSPSIRKLYEQLKRKRADLTKTVVEKIPPHDVVCIY
jgi:hypothetical protein